MSGKMVDFTSRATGQKLNLFLGRETLKYLIFIFNTLKYRETSINTVSWMLIFPESCLSLVVSILGTSWVEKARGGQEGVVGV